MCHYCPHPSLLFDYNPARNVPAGLHPLQHGDPASTTITPIAANCRAAARRHQADKLPQKGVRPEDHLVCSPYRQCPSPLRGPGSRCGRHGARSWRTPRVGAPLSAFDEPAGEEEFSLVVLDSVSGRI